MRWTFEAERWLREIHDFIAQDNPDAAQRTVRGIFERAEALADFPERGYRHASRSKEVVRVLLYGHYRIAYRVKSTGDVDILGIFTGPSTSAASCLDASSTISADAF